MKKYVVLAGLLFIVLVMGIFTIQENLDYAAASGAQPDLPVVGSLAKFQSLLSQMEEQNRSFSVPADFAVSEAGPASGAFQQESKGAETAGREFSQTNVQVQGVDEGDIVKTDGTYIYQVNNGRIVISKVNPPGEMKVLKVLRFNQDNFSPQELYVDSSFLVVIGTGSSTAYDHQLIPAPGAKIYPPPSRYRRYTKAVVYHIRDKKMIKQVRELELEGNYVSSRKLGSALYLVANKSIDRYSVMEKGQVDLPAYRDSAVGEKYMEIGLDKIRYFPNCSTPNYMLVAGIDLSQEGKQADIGSYLGSGENIYVSPSALYAAVFQYQASRPLIKDASAISPILPSQSQNTTIYKFALKDGSAVFQAAGKVPGTVLNQFSLDAYQGCLRVATTAGEVWRTDAGTSKNNVYVLDSGLKIIGRLENIAPGEKIYSARFVGSRAYLVTFKKVDPFFVIDLKNPQAPKILGALKIPGYSDYLHPVDADHILGFGKDTLEQKETGWGGEERSTAYYQGMKIALFDVRDVTHPVEKFKTVIGHRGTDSPLLYDHKALLFDKRRGLLAFPVTVMEVKEGSTSAAEYGQFTFQGAYIYSFSTEKGFALKGKITHLRDEDLIKSGLEWYDSFSNIERVLYIDETLYTVSRSMIKANDLNTLEPKSSLLLPQ